MNIGQILEIYLGWCVYSGWKVDVVKGVLDWVVRLFDELFEVQLNVIVLMLVFDGVQEVELQGLLLCMLFNCDGDVLVDVDGKVMFFDGCSGELFLYLVMVGYMYIMKLYYLVDDKIYVCFIGLYLMIIQQLLGGKVQFGGQWFGEMECWVMQVYGVVYILQELLIIKFDDIVGCVKVYEVIVKGENILELGIFELFKVLFKELQLLCFNVEVLLSDGVVIELCEGEDEDLEWVVVNLGINLFCNEFVSVEDFV